jgi:hypothetical protein
VLSHGIGQAGPTLDRAPDLAKRLGELWVSSMGGRERKNSIKRQASTQQRCRTSGPLGDGGALADSARPGRRAAHDHLIDGHEVEVLPFQLGNCGLARGRLQDAFDQLTSGAGRSVPEPGGHA